VKPEILDEVSRLVQMDRDAVLEQGLAAFLRDRRRRLKLERREILSRYSAEDSSALEEMLRSGQVPDHPAWEDLITVENLEDTIRTLDAHLRDLPAPA